MLHVCFTSASFLIDLLKQLARRVAPVAMEHSSKLGKGADVCEEAEKQIREAISFNSDSLLSVVVEIVMGVWFLPWCCNQSSWLLYVVIVVSSFVA